MPLRNFVPLSTSSADTDAAQPKKAKRSKRRTWLRVLIGIVALPFVLIALTLILLYLPPVQDLARKKAVAILEESTGTTIRLESLHLRFPLGVRLQGLFVADERGDTLIHAGTIKTSLAVSSLLRKRILLDPVVLTDVRANMEQFPDSTFNFDFIIDALAGDGPKEEKAPKDSTGGFDFAIGDVRLVRIHFTMDMEPSGMDMDLRLGELALDFDRFGTDPLEFHVDDLMLKDTRLDLRTTSGEAKPPPYPDLENPLAEIDVRFESIALENVFFTMKTIDSPDSLWIAVEQAGLNTRSMDLTQQQLALKNFELEGLVFGMVAATKPTPVDSLSTPDPLWLDKDDGFRFWTQDWDLGIEELRINGSSIALHSDSIASPALLFDPAHLVFHSIALDASDVSVNNKGIAIDLEKLFVQGGPDKTAVELALDLNATPAQLTVVDGHVRAMDNELLFRLAASPGDLSKAYRDPNSVPMEAEVTTTLRMNDLIPLLAQVGVELPSAAAVEELWDTHLFIAGSANNVDTVGLNLSGDQGSRVRVTGRTRKADRWPHSNFNIDVEELTMGAGMRQVARAFAPPDVVLPGRLSLRGNASGESGTMRTVLALDSDLGKITGFATVNDWNGTIPDRLDMAITTTNLDLGRILGDTAFAPVDLKLVANGKGLNSNTRNGSLTLIPTDLVYGGHDLSSLRLFVKAYGDSIDLNLAAQAEPVDLLLDAKGRWPAKDDSLAMDLDLIVRKLHLQEIGVTGYPLNIDGRISGRLAFLTEGFGRVALAAPGLRLSNENEEFTFEEFSLMGLLATDSTAVELDSDAFTVNYHSNMGVDSLMPRTREKLVSYFQEEGTFTPVPDRAMDLAITLPRTEWLTSIVLPDLQTIELRNFSGSYDSNSDILALNIDVPQLEYDRIILEGLTVDVNAEGNRLQGALRLQRVERDSLSLDNIGLVARSANDTLYTTLRIIDQEKEQYRIGLALGREDGVPVLHMDDEFILNFRTWTANPANQLHLAEDGLRAEAFELQSQDERIALRTGQRRNHIELTTLRITSLTELIHTGDTIPFINGVINGTVSLPFMEEGRLKADLTIKQLAVQGVEVGGLRLQATEVAQERYSVQVDLKSPGNRLTAQAEADLSGTKPEVQAEADLALGDLRFLKPFVKDYLYTVEGGLEGTLTYRQTGDDVKANGRVTFNDAGIGVIQTGSTYRLPKETLVLDDKGLLLENMTVLDSVGNKFRLDGRVHTAMDKTPELDLRLRTDRFQLVNSTIEENEMFFGNLFGNIDLRIEGTATSPVVRGAVGILDGTHLSIVLPGSKVEMIDHEGIVLFTEELYLDDTLKVNADTEMLRDSLAAQLPGVELDLRVKIDKRAVFAVVIDPTTGDQATFSGEADLVFRYSPTGELFLSGPFTVADGGYTLEFYGLVKKRFELVPGGTVVWDGDPLLGRMDIQARYRSETAPFPLVASAGGGVSEGERNRLQARLPFEVLININGAIESPTIGFGLDLDRMSRNTFPQVSNRIDQLSKASNEEELNRQVFGLLVLNAFIQDEGAGGAPSSGIATTAARNSVNSILTDQLNRLTGEVVKGMDIQLGVNTYDQAAGNEVYQRTTVDYRVSQRLLNDRVTIEAGGSLGVDERDQDVSNLSSSRAAQYAIMYDVTKDGRVRLRLYHENAFDLYDGEIFNNGVAIMYTREFEENARDRERRRQEVREQREATRKEEAEQ